MPRPEKCRKIYGKPNAVYFKPAGIPVSQLELITLSLDEWESLRLADLLGFYQEEAALSMGVSRPTFGNIVASARKKVADALISGKAIKIEGGKVKVSERLFICQNCGHRWSLAFGLERPVECPNCKSADIYRNKPDEEKVLDEEKDNLLNEFEP